MNRKNETLDLEELISLTHLVKEYNDKTSVSLKDKNLMVDLLNYIVLKNGYDLKTELNSWLANKDVAPQVSDQYINSILIPYMCNFIGTGIAGIDPDNLSLEKYFAWKNKKQIRKLFIKYLDFICQKYDISNNTRTVDLTPDNRKLKDMIVRNKKGENWRARIFVYEDGTLEGIKLPFNNYPGFDNYVIGSIIKNRQITFSPFDQGRVSIPPHMVGDYNGYYFDGVNFEYDSIMPGIKGTFKTILLSTKADVRECNELENRIFEWKNKLNVPDSTEISSFLKALNVIRLTHDVTRDLDDQIARKTAIGLGPVKKKIYKN